MLINQSMEESVLCDDFNIEKKDESDIVIALAGNPNVGKSTVFNALTGMRQHTGNWAGKTVSGAVGYAKKDTQGYCVVDLPGCYSLEAHSAEEEVSKRWIASGVADAIIVVCDGTCLERNLILALQILHLTSRVVVCINLLDEARKKNIEIDLEKLEEKLGVPVVGTEARRKKGLPQLLSVVDVVVKKPMKKIKQNREDDTEKEIRNIVQTAEEISREVTVYTKGKPSEKDRKIDRILTGKIWAFPIMFALLMMIFWLTIEGANYPSEVLSTFLFSLEEPLLRILSWLPQWISEMLVFGAFRVTAWVVSVMLPPMAIFFPLFTLLEDLGYLPRVAFNLDRCFKKCRACGKQALTM